MAFMKQNVNLGLLLLIIVVMISFTGFTVFYQKTFEGLSQDYNTRVGEVRNLVSTLQSEKVRLNQTSFQLKLKEEREQSLSEKYTELNAIKEGLVEDKSRLTGELLNTKNQLTQAQADVAAKDVQISGLNQEITDLNSDVRRWKARADQAEANLATCEAGP
ncbi:MAG TPA: hypothetical protein VJB08_03280 [Candidatus Nanoarchaeia archaeon]|nr:hypothetical protein [Candidatus Nanoarchaeia archaeon]